MQETQRPHDRDQVAAFTETVGRVQALGDDTVLLMACGLQELLRGVAEEERAGLERVQDFLDEFYQVRWWVGGVVYTWYDICINTFINADLLDLPYYCFIMKWLYISHGITIYNLRLAQTNNK